MGSGKPIDGRPYVASETEVSVWGRVYASALSHYPAEHPKGRAYATGEADFAVTALRERLYGPDEEDREPSEPSVEVAPETPPTA